MKKKITIREIAKIAGVGVGTVSRVLNGGAVKPETKKLVMDTIERLGYVPNASARKLAGGKTKSVMMLTPEIKTEFHWRLIKSMDKYLDEMDYQTIIYPLISKNRFEKLFSSHNIHEVDGVVLCTLTFEKTFGQKKNIDFPIVLLEGLMESYDSVYLDNYLGGVQAAEVLLEDKASEFFVLYYEETNPLLLNDNILQRLKGFQDRLNESGIELPDENVINVDFFLGSPHEKIVQVLTKVDKPGIFATTDNFALNVLETAKTLGKTPGKDFFLIGYDDQFWAEELGLTTISQPIEEMGKTAGELILKRIENPLGPVQHVKFLPAVVRRNTA